MFVEKYNFIVIEKKRSNFNDIEIYIDDFYNEYSDEEYYDDFDDSDEDKSDEKIQMKKNEYINVFNIFITFFFKKRKI